AAVQATEGLDTGVTTVATFTDQNALAPVSDFVVDIAWGDGSYIKVSGGAVVSLGGGTFAVRAGHNYGEEGNYALSVQVFDAGGSSVSGSGALTVADAALSGLSITDPGATEAAGFSGFTVATFTDGNSGAPATDFTATVTWGDGTSSAASVAATGTPG